MNGAGSLVSSNSMYNNRTIEIEEMFDGGYYPEKRLWVAVVLTALTEYQDSCQRAALAWKVHNGKPVNRVFLSTLQAIRKDCGTAWFRQICMIAGVDQKTVFKKFDSYDEKHGILDIRFTERDEIVSRYYIEKIKNKQHRIRTKCKGKRLRSA